jgi:hypothetical protein
MQAVAYNTVPAPSSPWAAPGQYTIKLTVSGKTYSQPMTVRLDPRVKTPSPVLDRIFGFSKQLYYGSADSQAALQQLREIRAQVKSIQEKAGEGDMARALAEFDQKAAALEGASGGAGGRGAGGRGAGGAPPAGGGRGGGGAVIGQDTLSAISGTLNSLISPLQAAEAEPPELVVAQINDRLKAFADLNARWTTLKTVELPALNAQLKQAKLPTIEIK